MPGGDLGPAVEEGGVEPGVEEDGEPDAMLMGEGVEESGGKIVLALAFGDFDAGETPEVELVAAGIEGDGADIVEGNGSTVIIRMHELR